MITLNSLAARLVASASLWCVVVLAAGGVLLSEIFADHVVRSFDERLNTHLENLAAVSALKDGALTLEKSLADPRFDQPYSGLYWQIESSNGRAIARSRSLWDKQLDDVGEVANDAPRYRDVAGPDEQRLRLLSRVIALSDSHDHRFVFKVGADTAEQRAEIRRFNQVLVRSLTVLGLGLLSAVLIQVHFGLMPLRRVKNALAAIRAGRAARLESNLPSEITPLADELNALLAHNAEVVERARTHVGNLAHALKTPLAVLQNESRARDDTLASIVANQTALMRRHVDYYLARARTAATVQLIGARTDVKSVLDSLARTLSRVHIERDIVVSVHCPDSLHFRGERQDLEEVVGNLADNACKWAKREVRLRGEGEGKSITIIVDDDGPGLEPERRDVVLERGKRFDEHVSGSGLGLSIVKDIIELYAGTLHLDDAPSGGLRARIVLPRA